MKFDVTAQYGNVDLSTFKVETDATLTSPQLVIDDSTTVNLTPVAATSATSATCATPYELNTA